MDYSPRYGQFRAMLRRIRLEARLTQTQLAAKLGKPQLFVSRSELGERRIDFLETLDFCRACGISGNQFIERLERAAPEREQKRGRRRSPRRMDSEGRLTGS
jgi:transcriptional regulator with XRE-family HTH domain